MAGADTAGDGTPLRKKWDHCCAKKTGDYDMCKDYTDETGKVWKAAYGKPSDQRAAEAAAQKAKNQAGFEKTRDGIVGNTEASGAGSQPCSDLKMAGADTAGDG